MRPVPALSNVSLGAVAKSKGTPGAAQVRKSVRRQPMSSSRVGDGNSSPYGSTVAAGMGPSCPQKSLGPKRTYGARDVQSESVPPTLRCHSPCRSTGGHRARTAKAASSASASPSRSSTRAACSSRSRAWTAPSPLSPQIAEAKAVGAAMLHRDGASLAELAKDRPGILQRRRPPGPRTDRARPRLGARSSATARCSARSASAAADPSRTSSAPRRASAQADAVPEAARRPRPPRPRWLRVQDQLVRPPRRRAAGGPAGPAAARRRGLARAPASGAAVNGPRLRLEPGADALGLDALRRARAHRLSPGSDRSQTTRASRPRLNVPSSPSASSNAAARSSSRRSAMLVRDRALDAADEPDGQVEVVAAGVQRNSGAAPRTPRGKAQPLALLLGHRQPEERADRQRRVWLLPS